MSVGHENLPRVPVSEEASAKMESRASVQTGHVTFAARSGARTNPPSKVHFGLDHDHDLTEHNMRTSDIRFGGAATGKTYAG